MTSCCRRQFLHLVAAASALPALSAVAQTQAYPAKPITIIVPYPAGGPTDSITRLVIEPMREALGQPIIIENVGGAGGTIGVAPLSARLPTDIRLVQVNGRRTLSMARCIR
jgi:tripartite-type tricarboxylate transporter receptor subunit TctC